MDERKMMDFSALSPTPLLPACFVGGLVIGYGYFSALRATTDLILRDGKPLIALALTIGRMSLLASALFIAVLIGGAALLAAFAGVLCAKALMLYRLRREIS
nr:ATP synthase subunit I [Rhodovulum visakhapatnamense]